MPSVHIGGRMKVIKRDMKHGTMVLRVENADDLWHLSHIVGPGDSVKSRTMRKVSAKAGGEYRLTEKRPMVFKLEVEKVGFEEAMGTLRLSGRITEGPPQTKLSSYHTIQVEPGTVITVTKERWGPSVMKRIAESGTRQPKVLVCVLDREEADIAIVRGTGIKTLCRIECEDLENRNKYHAEIVSFISAQEGFDVAIIAGPGFEAENVMRYAREKNARFYGKAVLEKASHTGINGINEVLKRSKERLLRDTRIGQESGAVEEVLSRIKTDGAVSYGKEDVRNALGMGAVETLLVSREKAHEFEEMMELCEKMRGKVKLVTADHPLGEQFLHLGGIAAILRFRINR
jgi:protein pelota